MNPKEYFHSNFSSDLWEKRKEKAIRIIMESIALNLKKPYHYFSYWDILRCARANVYMADDTMECVDKALQRTQLTEVFPKNG